MSVLAHASREAHALKCELASEVLRTSGSLRFRVTGWSMMPAVRPGDTLIVERVKAASLHEGDIVLFERDRHLFAHRLAKSRANSQLVTRGDAMPAADPAIGEEELLGKVWVIERNGKSITPRRKPAFSSRAIAFLVGNSPVAARAIAALHRRQQSHKSNSHNRVVTCQN